MRPSSTGDCRGDTSVQAAAARWDHREGLAPAVGEWDCIGNHNLEQVRVS